MSVTSINYKRKIELSRAMALANKTRDLKRKMELYKALAATHVMDATSNMVDDPIGHSTPQTLGKKKRVSVPMPIFAGVQRKESTMQYVPNESNENMRADAIESLSKKKRASFPMPEPARVQMEEPVVQHVTDASNGNIRTNATESLNKKKRASFRVPEPGRVQMEESVVQHMTNASNENIRINATESITNIVDSTSDATNGPPKEKRGRGLTRGLNTQKYIRKCGEKPKIVIPKEINKPVGEHSSKHATQIGVLIRVGAPMQVEGWAKIPEEKKDDLFRKLINKLSYDVEEPHVVRCIWKSFAKQYSTFRSNAHKHYQKNREQGGVALARETIYEKLANRRDDWLWLCDFWETTKFKNLSEKQSNNRGNLKYTHKLGTKSRAAHQHENKLDDVDMYTAEFYNPKNGWADEKAEANSAKMKELKEQQQALPEGDRMSAEQICISVLGENSSYAKSKGLNKKSSRGNVSLPSEVSANGARLEEELASTQAELENAKAELAIQKTIVEAVVKFVEKMTSASFSEIIDFSN